MKKVKKLEEVYGIENLIEKLGRNKVVFPIVGVESGTYRLQQLKNNFSFKNVIHTLRGKTGFLYMSNQYVEPIIYVSSLDEYIEQYIKQNAQNFKFTVAETFTGLPNIVSYKEGFFVDYIMDAQGRKYHLTKKKLQELFGNEPDMALRKLKFDLIVDSGEKLSLEDIKNELKSEITGAIASKYKGKQNEISNATSMDELFSLIK